MSVRTDQINLNVNINGNVAQNQLNELRKRAADLALDMKGLKKGTQEYIDANKQLSSVTAQMSDLKKEIGLTSLNEKELNAEIKKLKALKGSVAPFSAEFKDLQAQINAANKRLYDVKNGVTGLASVFSRVSDSVKQFGVVAASYLGFQFITSQFKNIIQGAGKLSDQLADLRRVTGLTADEVVNLNSGLSKLDTRTSTSGLRDIAIVAGKLGVAKEDILGFTKAVDMLVVALGDELGDADQITTQLGKILNVFDGKITGDNISKLGNAIVDLANKGVATGGFIVDFTQRLSGIAKTSNIALPALLGLGAGLEETGAKVESASTAITKLITNIAQDVPKAAKIAGATTQAEIDKFADTFAKAPQEALLQFAEGLQRNKKDFAEIADSFKDAGESGARVITTLATLGAKTDFFREKIVEAGSAIKDTTAIQNAFALKNETLGATLDKLGKEFYKFVMSSGITSFLKGAVEGVSSFIKALRDLPKFLNDNKGALYTLISAALIYNAALIKSAIVTTALKIETIASAIATKGAAIATAIAETATASYIVVTNLLTGKIKLATAAQRLWNIASSLGAGAIGLIIVAGVALVSILEKVFTNNSKIAIQQKAQADLAHKTAEAYGDQVNKLEILKKALEDNNQGLETKKKAYQELIALNPDFVNTLRLDAQGHLQGAYAIDEYIKALKKKGEAEAAQNLSDEKNQQILKLQQERYERTLKGDATINGGKGSVAFQYDIAKIDEKIKALQTAKEFFDKKIVDALSGSGTREYTLPADTLVPGQKPTGEDASVAARRIALQKMIDDSKAAYEKLNKNDEAGQLANLALRKKYEAELDALDHKENKKSGGSKNTEYDRLINEAKAFYQKLQELKEDAANADKTKDEKDLINLEQKYAELHAKALEYFKKNVTDRKTYTAEEKLIVEAFNNDLAALQKKQFEARSGEEYARAIKDTQEYFDEQKHLESQKYTEGLQTKEEYDTNIHNLDLQSGAQQVQVATDYSGTVKKAAGDITKFKKTQLEKQDSDNRDYTEKSIQYARDEILAKAKLAVISAPKNSDQRDEAQKKLLKTQFEQDPEIQKLNKNSEQFKIKEQELQDALAQIDEEGKQRRIKIVEDYANQVANITANLIQTLNNLDQRALQKDKKINDAKIADYKRQLDHKLISQKQYDAKVAAANEEMDKKKAESQAKQAKREKAQAIFEAVINTASAIAEALPNIPLSVIAGVLGAAQIAAIVSTPPPDATSYGEGGLIKNGPYHSDSSKGLPLINPETGKTELLLEKDEAVVKGAAVRDPNTYTVTGTPSQITSELNSMHGGKDWQAGAVIGTPKLIEEDDDEIKPNPPAMGDGGLIKNVHHHTSSQISVPKLPEEEDEENKINPPAMGDGGLIKNVHHHASSQISVPKLIGEEDEENKINPPAMGDGGLIKNVHHHTVTQISVPKLPEEEDEENEINPPAMGNGGLIKNGPYHRDASGGLPLINPETGQTELLLEKDEAVVKGKAVRDPNTYTVTGTPSQITSKLNSMHGGVNWHTGALISMPKFRERPPQISTKMPRIMGNGGLISPRHADNTPGYNDSRVVDMLSKVLDATERKNDRKSYVVLSEMQAQARKYDSARRASGLG